MFFIKTSLLISAFTIILSLQHYINGTSLAGTLNICISVACFLNLYFFKKIGDLEFSAHILLSFCLMFLTSHILTSNKEYYAYHLVWSGCFPIFASTLLAKRSTQFWTLLSFVALGGALSMRHFGVDFAIYEITGTKLLTSSLLSLFFSMLLIYNLVKNYKEKERLYYISNQIIEEEKSHLETAVSYNISNNANSIRLIAEEVLNNQKDSRLIDFSQKILERLEGIEQVVKNIDDKESSEISVNPTPIDLLQSLKEVRDLYQDRLAKKNLRFLIETEEKPPKDGYMVTADSQTISTPILSNIISNAINYSGNAYQIHAKLRVLEDHYIVLEIRDMGPGMTKAKINNVLNPLSVGTGREDDHGRALNLATVKSYLELVGARLYVDSRPKEIYPESHGTSMRITFIRSMENKKAS